MPTPALLCTVCRNPPRKRASEGVDKFEFAALIVPPEPICWIKVCSDDARLPEYWLAPEVAVAGTAAVVVDADAAGAGAAPRPS